MYQELNIEGNHYLYSFYIKKAFHIWFLDNLIIIVLKIQGTDFLFEIFVLQLSHFFLKMSLFAS